MEQENKPTIFVDMDGVLADFDKQACAVHGLVEGSHDYINFEKTYGADAFWNPIYAATDGHPFANLEVMQGAQDAVAALQVHHHVVVLTKLPKRDKGRDTCKAEKEAWLAMHFPDVPIICVPGGVAKGEYITKPGDILIDDFQVNLDTWNAVGGTSLLHYSWRDTLRALRRHGLEIPEPTIEFKFAEIKIVEAIRGGTGVRITFEPSDDESPEFLERLHLVANELARITGMVLVDAVDLAHMLDWEPAAERNPVVPVVDQQYIGDA